MGYEVYEVDDFVDLPENPEDAFVEFYKKNLSILNEAVESGKADNSWDYERQFINSMIAFDDVYKTNILVGETGPKDGDSVKEYIDEFLRVLNQYVLKLQLTKVRESKLKSSELAEIDITVKAKIRALIEKIRVDLEAIECSSSKREALFAKLNSFGAELDQTLTRFEKFNAFAVEIARTFGTVSKEVKPVWDRIDRILEWLDKSKSQDLLEHSEEPKQIEHNTE